MTEIGLLFRRKLLELLREPVWIVSEFSMPVLYLALFAPLLKGLQSSALGGNVLNTFVPGLLTLFAFSSGIGEAWTIVNELQTGVTERFRVSPASRFSLLMGSVLRDTLIFLASALLLISISCLFGFTASLPGLVILLLLLCLLTATISATAVSIGLLLKTSGSVAALITTLQLPITLLSGVLLPITIGPMWLQVIAHFNPLFYLVEASRVLTAGSILNVTVLEAAAIMVPLTAFVLWWATRVYRKVVA
ncbi:ABC transporter permease [Oscillospiraceae bacterium WX1]